MFDILTILIMIKYRNRQILKILINQEKTTGSELASIFNVSTRTIRNDIQNINNYIKEFGCEIKSNVNGYSMDGNENDCNKIQSYLKSEDGSFRNEPEYRIKYLLLKLASQKYSDLDRISEDLFISLSCLLTDIKNIESTMEILDISFKIHRQKNQIYLEYENENIFCLEWAKIFTEDLNELDFQILNSLSVRNISFEELILFLSNILTQHSLWLSKQEITFFTSLIFVHAIQSGQATNNDYCSFNQNSIIESINLLLFKKYIISLTPQALSEINIVFDSLSKSKIDDTNDQIIRPILLEIFHKVDGIFGTKLTKDTQLIDGIINHLVYYFSREALHINFIENIKAEIREVYPLSYNISKFLVSELAKYKQLNYTQLNFEQNIFLSIHIQASLERNIHKRKYNVLVISSLGFASTKLLETQLKNEFEHLEILASVASYAYRMIDFTDIDIIITTTPVSINQKIPIVEVSVPFTKESIDKVKEVLNSNFFWTRNIYPVLIELSDELTNEKDVFAFIEDVLKPIEGEVKVYDKLVEREYLYTTNIGKGITMPHIIYEGKLNYNLYFFYSVKGVQWKDSVIHLVSLILITTEAKDYINDYMKLINQIYLADNVKSFKQNMLFKQLETFAGEDKT